MGFITEFLAGSFFENISDMVVGYLNDGLTFFGEQDILIQTGILVGGVIVIFLGAIDLVKKLSKLIIVAVVIFGLWFVYSNYLS
jgi:hypothetical protein